MTDREKLELAAKAYWGDEIGDVVSIEWGEQDDGILYTHADNQDHNGRDCQRVWAPHREQADSDRMACKLRIDRQIITRKSVHCIKLGSPGRAVERGATHDNTDEDVCRAVREARLLVAAEIGRGMP